MPTVDSGRRACDQFCLVTLVARAGTLTPYNRSLLAFSVRLPQAFAFSQPFAFPQVFPFFHTTWLLPSKSAQSISLLLVRLCWPSLIPPVLGNSSRWLLTARENAPFSPHSPASETSASRARTSRSKKVSVDLADVRPKSLLFPFLSFPFLSFPAEIRTWSTTHYLDLSSRVDLIN